MRSLSTSMYATIDKMCFSQYHANISEEDHLFYHRSCRDHRGSAHQIRSQECHAARRPHTRHRRLDEHLLCTEHGNGVQHVRGQPPGDCRVHLASDNHLPDRHSIRTYTAIMYFSFQRFSMRYLIIPSLCILPTTIPGAICCSFAN